MYIKRLGSLSRGPSFVAWDVERIGITPLTKCGKVVRTVSSTSVEISAATMPITMMMDVGECSIKGIHPTWIVDCALYKNLVAKYINCWVAPPGYRSTGKRILGRLSAFVAHKKFHDASIQ